MHLRLWLRNYAASLSSPTQLSEQQETQIDFCSILSIQRNKHLINRENDQCRWITGKEVKLTTAKLKSWLLVQDNASAKSKHHPWGSSFQSDITNPECAEYSSKLVAKAKRHDHETSLLGKLHLLPIKNRVIFMIILLTFKTPNNKCPLYFKKHIRTPPQVTRKRA